MDKINKNISEGFRKASGLDVASDMPSSGGIFSVAQPGFQQSGPVSSMMGATGSMQGLFSGIGNLFTALKNLDADLIRKDNTGVILTIMRRMFRGIIKIAQFVASGTSSAISAITTLAHNLDAKALLIAGKVTSVVGSALGVASGLLLAIPSMVRSVFTFGLAGELNRNVKIDVDVNGNEVTVNPAKLKDLLKRLKAQKEQMSFMETVLNPPLTDKENKYLVSLGYDKISDADKIAFVEKQIVSSTQKNFKRLLNDKVARKTIARIAKELPVEFKKLNSKEGLTAADIKKVEMFLLKRAAMKLAIAIAAIASITIGIIATVATAGSAIAIGATIAGLVMSGVWIGVDGADFAESFKSITADNGNTTDKVLKGVLIATTVLSILGAIALTVATGGVGAAVAFAVIGSIIAATGGSFAVASLAKSGVLEFNAMKAKLALMKFAKGDVEADSYTVFDTEKYLSMMKMYLKTSTPSLEQLGNLITMTEALKSNLEPSFAKGIDMFNAGKDAKRNSKVSKKLDKLVQDANKEYTATLAKKAKAKKAKAATLIQRRFKLMLAKKAMAVTKMNPSALPKKQTDKMKASKITSEVIRAAQPSFQVNIKDLQEVALWALGEEKTTKQVTEQVLISYETQESRAKTRELYDRVQRHPGYKKAKRKVADLKRKFQLLVERNPNSKRLDTAEQALHAAEQGSSDIQLRLLYSDW